MLKNTFHKHGFTIVELLVVIVVIGILAAITVVSYSGITKKATTAALQSDTANASKQLELFKATNGNYPTTNNCAIADNTTNLCLKSSNGTLLTYQIPNITSPKSYTLYASNAAGSQIVMKTNQSSIKNVTKICPTNFVFVAGSITYNTSDFCAMKYEARVQGVDNGYYYTGPNIAESRPTGGPWTGITKANATIAAATACTGCHLMTTAEWMTIAQNIASVASNWSGGIVGNGYIYTGLEYVPSYTFAASDDDSNGYFGVTDNPELIQYNLDHRRTLTLADGQTIWDFTGDAQEWAPETTSGISANIDVEWPNILSSDLNLLTAQLGANPSPAGTGITGANIWESTAILPPDNLRTPRGIGKPYIYSGANGVIRGRNGIFDFRSYNIDSTSSSVGFRSTK